MGKWATYRRRGGGGQQVGQILPSPPLDADWQVGQSAPLTDPWGEGFSSPPSGYDEFGFQFQVDAPPDTYAGAVPAGTQLPLTGDVPGSTINVQARWEDSSAVLPPSGWSTVQSLLMS